MTIQAVAEQAILWYQAYLGCDKGKAESERMAVQQVVERYGNDYDVVRKPTPLLDQAEAIGSLPVE